MKIDFHTHIFPDKLAPKVIPKLEQASRTNAYTNGTIADLQRSMQRAQVDLSVIMPVASSASQVVTCNNFAYEINQTYDNLHSFGAMHPDYADYKDELERVKELGMRGIKLHPDYQQTRFDDVRYQKIIARATELDLIVLVHAGIDIGLPNPVHTTPKMVCEVVKNVQPNKLVLAHMGGYCMWDEVIDTLADKNVYLDTAFSLGKVNYFDHIPQSDRDLYMMDEALFLRAVQAFGAERILFGTDNPWGGQLETVQTLARFSLTDAQKDCIFWKNAVELLGQDVVRA